MSADHSADAPDAVDDDLAPRDRANAAVADAIAELQAAGGTDAKSRGGAEQAAADRVADGVARALVDGLTDPAGPYAKQVAAESDFWTPTDLKARITDRVEELEAGGGNERLDEYVENELEKVTVVRTTDHRQGAEYVWDFGAFKVETRSGKDGRGHFSWPNFRDYILESGGVNVEKPQKDRLSGDAWRDFIVDVLDRRGTEKTVTGKRTQALEALQRKLTHLTGYGTPEGALDHTGIWVKCDAAAVLAWRGVLPVGDPSDARDLEPEHVDHILVHESVLGPLLDDLEVTRSAFYHELSARGLTVTGAHGASDRFWVNGSEERFWKLSADVGPPRTYIPDPSAREQTHTGTLFGGDDPDAPAGTDGTDTDDDADGGETADETDDTGGFDSVGDVA